MTKNVTNFFFYINTANGEGSKAPMVPPIVLIDFLRAVRRSFARRKNQAAYYFKV